MFYITLNFFKLKTSEDFNELITIHLILKSPVDMIKSIPLSHHLKIIKYFSQFSPETYSTGKQRTENSKTILTENKVGEILLSDFKDYYKATIIKTCALASREIN